MSKSNRLGIIVSFLIVVTASIGVVIIRGDAFGCKSLSDEKLIQEFHDHYTTFESLRKTITENSNLWPVISESSFRSHAFGEPATNQIEFLFSTIKPCSSIGFNYDTVRFVFGGGGLSAISPGWVKGVEYISGDARRKGVILDNLDHADRLPANVYLREMQSNWFLFYQREDD